MDWALNNLQWLICHKIKAKPNQTKSFKRANVWGLTLRGFYRNIAI